MSFDPQTGEIMYAAHNSPIWTVDEERWTSYGYHQMDGYRYPLTAVELACIFDAKDWVVMRLIEDLNREGYPG